MRNNRRLTTWSVCTGTLLFLAVAIHANPVLFDKQSYNFSLSGGSGGKSAFDSNHNAGTFSIAFSNVIYVPRTGYSAYLPALSALSDPRHARFGSNSSWQTFTINGGDFNDAGAAFTNGAAGFGGYQTTPPPPVLGNLAGNSSAAQNSNQSFTNFSDSTITGNGTGKPLNCGFQEPPTTVPEPRAAVWIVMGRFAKQPMIGKR